MAEKQHFTETNRNPSQDNKNTTEMYTGDNFQMSPFDHIWVFGHDAEVLPLNLTMKGKPRILYVSSHLPIIYDYGNSTMSKLKGHKNKVTQIARDITGQWIVTSDCGKDNVIIIWDSNKGVPVHTLFDTYPEGCDLLLELSPCAKYLVIVSHSEEQVLHIWEWVFGHEKPNDVLLFDKKFGKIKTISFCPDATHFILATSEQHITFLLYENGVLQTHVPNTIDLWSKKLKNIKFNDSTYIDGTNSRFAVSATNLGFAVMWSDLPYGENDDSKPVSLIKKPILKLRLSRKSITVICSINKLVITADSGGWISFYDQKLKLKTFINSFNLDCITALSFDPFSTAEVEEITTDSGSQFDSSSQNDEAKMKCPQSDLSMYENPPEGRNFVVCTKKGYVGYVNFKKLTIDYLLRPFPNPTAIDSNPMLHYFCVGTQDATLMLIDYRTKEIKIDTVLHHVPKNCYKPIKKVSPITCLQHSSDGFFIACGQENGNLWILDPLILTSEKEDPFTYSKGSIIKVEFSGDSDYMAVADSTQCICLYSTEDEIVYIGKYRSHYKTINDLTFLTTEFDFPQLFSVGEDRSLVEYDIERSVAEKKIIIHNTDRIDQSGIPLCVLPHPDKMNSLIICSSQGKYRVIDIETKRCTKTAQGPMSSPVHILKILPPVDDNMPKHFVYAAGNYIGIQKMPLDGNPFKTISVLGSASQITQICCSFDGRFLFTIGRDDGGVHIWQIKREMVDILENLGGSGLEPYFCLLDGGKYGPVMNEIKDFFYYCQIMHEGEHSLHERPVLVTMSLCELADFMRALGFYPSDYDVTNMLHEVSEELETDKTGRIHFDDLVRLYINHRPTTGISEAILREAYLTFAEEDSQDSLESTNPVIIVTNFLAVLEGTGEMFNRTETTNYLNALLSKNGGIDEKKIIYSLPDDISFEFFCDELLGTWRGYRTEKIVVEDKFLRQKSLE